GVKQVEYLGFIVDKHGKHIDPNRTRALREFPKPGSIKAVRRLLGTLNYLREFIPFYTEVVAPISDLVKSKNKFIWSHDQERALENVCDIIEKNQTLFHYDPRLELILRTDASSIGIGGLLVQVDHGKEFPLAFYSKKLTEQERRWSTLEQEAFGVVWCLRKARQFVSGRSFTIETDHRNLTFVLKNTSPKVMRWHLELAEYQFEIRHIAGKQNVVADTLSRGTEEPKQSIIAARAEIQKTLDPDEVFKTDL
ncbi:unnamed protein product, partial [Aduncisulcus paluster]